MIIPQLNITKAFCVDILKIFFRSVIFARNFRYLIYPSVQNIRTFSNQVDIKNLFYPILGLKKAQSNFGWSLPKTEFLCL